MIGRLLVAAAFGVLTVLDLAGVVLDRVAARRADAAGLPYPGFDETGVVPDVVPDCVPADWVRWYLDVDGAES
jgi:predicted outer membrane lipoprotein